MVQIWPYNVVGMAMVTVSALESEVSSALCGVWETMTAKPQNCPKCGSSDIEQMHEPEGEPSAKWACWSCEEEFTYDV